MPRIKGNSLAANNVNMIRGHKGHHVPYLSFVLFEGKRCHQPWFVSGGVFLDMEVRLLAN